MEAQRPRPRYIDIGANLLDEAFQGRYNGQDKQYHAPDLPAVLQRAWDAGVERIIITAGSLHEARAALALARTDERLFSTVGVHPTRCGKFESHPGGPQAYLEELEAVLREGAAEGKVVAVGEAGLDYDRLHFCDAATQRTWFAAQFRLAAASRLPMFLHLRAAAADFLEIWQQHEADCPAGGVVHSFDGSAAELQQLLRHPQLRIGINGCSIKSEANLEVMAAVPLDRLLLETDSPWCEIRPSHAGFKHVQTKYEAKDRKKHEAGKMVKSRNEPACIAQVLEVVAGHRGIADKQQLSEQIWDNTTRLFFPEQR
eukprot:scaffold5.g630.t1